ncbi:MAG: hypothetical protein V3S46_01455, partial [Nitrospinota bacterium]
MGIKLKNKKSTFNELNDLLGKLNPIRKILATSAANLTLGNQFNAIKRTLMLSDTINKTLVPSIATKDMLRFSNTINETLAPSIAIKETLRLSNTIYETMVPSSAIKNMLRLSNTINEAMAPSIAIMETLRLSSTINKTMVSAAANFALGNPLSAIQNPLDMNSSENIIIEPSISFLHKKPQVIKLPKESEDLLIRELEHTIPRLLCLLEGARRALERRDVDYLRHFGVSMRQLFEKLICKLAPSDEVIKWGGISKYLNKNGQPTWRGRIAYLR